MGTDKPWQMRGQLQSLEGMVDMEKLYVYRTTVRGKPFMSVLYGTYPDWPTARRAMGELPKFLRAHQPHLRTVGGINEEIKTVQ